MEEPTSRSPVASARRQRSTLCTICSVVGLLAAFVISYLAIEGTLSVKGSFNILHPDLMQVDPKLTSHLVPIAQPLLDRDTPFGIRATVWMDVTQHVEQGLPLPDDARLVSYSVHGANRSELILYDAVVAESVTSMSKASLTLPLNIPVHPLYSQELGPSSLRAAFTAVPSNETLSKLGAFIGANSLFRGSRLMLPRTLDSERLTPGHDFGTTTAVPSLEAALEQNSASISLLALLPAGIRHEQPEEGRSFDCASQKILQPSLAFLDNVYQNRHFVNRAHNDSLGGRLYLDNQCQLHLPHIRSRIGIVMLKDFRSFFKAVYTSAQREVAAEENRCHRSSDDPNVQQLLLASHCRNVREHGPLEVLLWFDGTSEDIGDSLTKQYRYAPSLRVSRTPGHPGHHLTLPRRRPIDGDLPALPPAGPCAVPHIELSEDPAFFHADVEVHFSAHQAIRTNMAEQLDVFEGSPPEPASGQLPIDVGQEVTLNSSMAMEYMWEAKAALVGDRIHPQHRPFLAAVPLLDAAVPFLVCILDTLYWSSRTTSAGLSITAQWIGAASLVLAFFSSVLGLIEQPDAASIIMFVVLVPIDLFRVYYQTLVLLRIQPSTSWRRLTRRPAWKGEVKSRAVEKLSPISHPALPAALVALFAGYHYWLRPHDLAVRQERGCFGSPDETPAFTLSSLISLASVSLAGTATVLQLSFNARCATFAGQLKWSVYIETVSAFVAMAVGQVELIGGWSSRRYAVTLQDVERLTILAIAAAQALRFSAVLQPLPGSGERLGEAESLLER